MSRRHGKHPATAPPRRRVKGGWRTIQSLLHDRYGVEFEEGERVVVALGVKAEHLDRGNNGNA
jgi:hypothetical protein